MHQLTKLFETILTTGQDKTDRTGTGTRSVFGYQMRFPLTSGFPLATRKFVPFKLIASELLWFLKGKQDQPGAIDDLHADGNTIWDEWAKEDGSFGPIYGVQWRNWVFMGDDSDWGRPEEGLDQIAELINTLKTNPDSRRMIVTAWQPAELGDMALPPCHILFQLNTRPVPEKIQRGWPAGKYMVDLQMYQRSCDSFLGVPFNIASYALLLHMLCHVAGPEYLPGDFVWTGGDVHLYQNHLEQAREFLRREEHPLPHFRFADDVPRDIDAITLEHCLAALTGYKHSGKLAAEVSV